MTDSESPLLGGRVAVVTGAAAGIGHELARTLATAGAGVACLDIDGEGAKAVAAELVAAGGRAIGVACDVSDPAAVESAFGRVDGELGDVDLLVNNAVVISHARPHELPFAEWQRVQAVNVTGPFLCAQALGRRLIARGVGGAIVNMSSIAGSSALGRGNLAYSASKGAIDAFTRELAVEWAPHGIRVNAIKPAQTMTPSLESVLADPALDGERLMAGWLESIPLGRLPEPRDMAAAMLFLVSDQARMITGALLPVDGGNLALNAGGSVRW